MWLDIRGLFALPKARNHYKASAGSEEPWDCIIKSDALLKYSIFNLSWPGPIKPRRARTLLYVVMARDVGGEMDVTNEHEKARLFTC